MNIIKHKKLGVIFGLSFLLLLVCFIWVFLAIGKVDSSLIIYFDIFKGVDYWGKPIDMFWILAICLAMLLVNLFLAEYIFERQRFFSFVFAFVSLTLAILTFISSLVILNIN